MGLAMELLKKEPSLTNIDPRLFRFLLQRANSLMINPSDVHAVRRRMEALMRIHPLPQGVTVRP